jgi:hypothetical protein
MDKLDKILNSLCTLFTGLLLMQFPAFLVQYLQRLGGHVDEAKSFALKTKLPEAIARSKELLSSYKDIESANIFLKLPSFIYNIDFDIAKKAYNKFVPGIVFNKMSIFYIIIGIVLGIIIYSGIKLFLKKIYSIITKKRTKKGKTIPPKNNGHDNSHSDLDNFDLSQFDNY